MTTHMVDWYDQFKSDPIDDSKSLALTLAVGAGVMATGVTILLGIGRLLRRALG